MRTWTVFAHRLYGGWIMQPRRHHMSQEVPSHYKAVIFDMYGVLLPSPVALASVFEQKNRVPLGTVGRAIRAGGDNNVWKRFMRGQLGAQDFIEAFSTQCSEIAGCTVNIGPFYSALTSGQMSRPVPLMLEAVHSIRQHGLKTALLTNNFQRPDGQPYQPLDPALFDVVVESVREGVSKPDRRIFERCLARLGVASRDAVFLDDLIFNVHAAAELGIHVIQVKEPAAAVRELEEALSFPLCGTESRLPVSESHRDTRHSAPQAREGLTHHLKSLLHLTEKDALCVQPLSLSLYLLAYRGRQLLFRTQQQGKNILEIEHRVLRALSGADLPIPKIIQVCEDSSILGEPFLLMEVCPNGRRLNDEAMRGLSPAKRGAVYEAMTQDLCRIHHCGAAAVLRTQQPPIAVLSVAQQVASWIQRYRASQDISQPIAALERLVLWLSLHAPSYHTYSLLHGNYSLSRLLFHPDREEVVCVFDWGEAGLGDPLLDVTSSCLQNHLANSGLAGHECRELDIPSPEQVIGRYCESMGRDFPPNWQFYMSLQLFCKAVQQGEGASEPDSRVEKLAEEAWDFATKESFRIFNSMPIGRN